MSLAPVDASFRIHRVQAPSLARDIKPLAYTFDEALSRPYRLEIDLPLEALAQQALVGLLNQRATLRFGRPGSVRDVHGIILRYEVINTGLEALRVRLVLGPELMLLERFSFSRIYAHANAFEIIKDILNHPSLKAWRFYRDNHSPQTEAADASSHVQFLLDPHFETLPSQSTLQYQESLLDFFHRLLADFGLTYVFEHPEGGPERLIITGNTALHFAAKKPVDVVLLEDAVRLTEGIHHLVVTQEPQLGARTHLQDVGYPAASRSLRSGLELSDNAAVFFGILTGKSTRNGASRDVDWKLQDAATHGLVISHLLFSSMDLTPTFCSSLVPSNDDIENQLNALESSSSATNEKPSIACVDASATTQRFDSNFSVEEECQNQQAEPKPDDDAMAQLQLVLGSASARRLGAAAHDGTGGASNCPNITTGHPLSMVSISTPYPCMLVTQVRHVQELERADSYENSFSCIPLAMPYAPAALPAAQPGLQMAEVVGPELYNLHLDKHGRVLVRFAWSNTDGASSYDNIAWARLSSSWAGPGYGAFFYPRVGTQVIVSFLDPPSAGPCVPVIMGTSYNETQRPPHGYGAKRSISGWRTESLNTGPLPRYNELTFDDALFREEVKLRAQRDLDITVQNQRKISVGKEPFKKSIKRLATFALDYLTNLALWQADHTLANTRAEKLIKIADLLKKIICDFCNGNSQSIRDKTLRSIEDRLVGERLLAETPQDIKTADELLFVFTLIRPLLSLLATQHEHSASSEKVWGDKRSKVSSHHFEEINGCHRRFVGRDSLDNKGFQSRAPKSSPQKDQSNDSSFASNNNPSRLSAIGLQTAKDFALEFIKEPTWREDIVIEGNRRDEVTGNVESHFQGKVHQRVKGPTALELEEQAKVSTKSSIEFDAAQDISLRTKKTVRCHAEDIDAKASRTAHLHAKKSTHVSSEEHAKISARKRIDIAAEDIVVAAGKSITFRQGHASITLKNGDVTIRARHIKWIGKKSIRSKSLKTQID